MRFTSIVSAGLLATAATASPVLVPKSTDDGNTTLIDSLKKEIVSWTQYVESEIANITASFKNATAHSRVNPWSAAPLNQYIDWTTFKANGVNLGNWLLLEYSSDQTWWDAQVPSNVSKDEWSFCEYLGSKCGPLLEKHYATYYNFSDIDKLASVGVNLLRVPMTYQAWVDMPGSQLYHGAQLYWFKRLTDYAILKHNMHIIIDLHALPGSCNGQDNGGALGQNDWWFNATNMDYTMQMVKEAVAYIELSGHPHAYTLSLINEAMTDPAKIGTNETISTAGVEYAMGYLNQSLAIVEKVNPKIPIMWQDSWLGEEFWSALIPSTANVVLDVHIYYFSSVLTDAYSKYFSYTVCGAGDYFVGNGNMPVFVGEWSAEILYNNSLSDRKYNFDSQRYAYATWGSGSAFWSARQLGIEQVSGEGIRSNYWCYECMIDDGVITEATTESYC